MPQLKGAVAGGNGVRRAPSPLSGQHPPPKVLPDLEPCPYFASFKLRMISVQLGTRFKQ